MRLETVTRELYKFDELSDTAKDKARAWYREGALHYDWYDCVYEDAKTIGKLMGIQISNIYFSGFWSQGDGACFEGSYAYAKGSVKAIKEYAPRDTELHRIVEALHKLQRSSFHQLAANVKHRGQYSHEHCTEIDVMLLYNDALDSNRRIPIEADNRLSELLRAYMRWIYKQLKTQYDYILSDECVDGMIIGNEYEFLIDGSKV